MFSVLPQRLDTPPPSSVLAQFWSVWGHCCTITVKTCFHWLESKGAAEFNQLKFGFLAKKDIKSFLLYPFKTVTEGLQGEEDYCQSCLSGRPDLDGANGLIFEGK